MSNFLINNNFTIPTPSAESVVIIEDVLEARAVFSINASNQLEGTAWVVRNGKHQKTSLGNLSYSIRDKDGVLVGIGALGVSPDLNGFYKLGPISSTALQDLAHYTVEIITSHQGETITGVVAITLGE